MHCRSILVGTATASLLAGCPEEAPKFDAAQTLGGVEVSAAVLNAGHRTYEMRCASCHGHDGAGTGPASTGLAEAPRDFRAANFKYKSTPGDALPTDADLDVTLRKGRLEGGMPAFGGLTNDDRAAVIQYLKTFSPRWAAAPTEAS
ncbi:MAG: cytochrome c [Myxococcota bacterium]